MIAAHADPRGDSDKNHVVAKARAKAARDYLVRFKLEDGRIKTIAFGKALNDDQQRQSGSPRLSCWHPGPGGRQSVETLVAQLALPFLGHATLVLPAIQKVDL